MSTRVCSFIDKGRSCPELAEPGASRCPKHARPKNASWSRDRNTSQQWRERQATLKRDHYTCQRCGHVDPTGKSLDAHHITPTRLVALCNSKANGCHRAVDSNAR